VSGDEYPELPTVSSEEALMLPISALTEGLKGTLFASATDETKQVLTGVHLLREADNLEFAATDGHRLAVVKTVNKATTEDDEDDEINEPSEIDESQNFALTIPARALRELENILKNAKDSQSITLFVDEGQVVFELGEQNLTSRKLDGTYPNYNQLIPRQFERTMVCDRKRLIESLERVSVLADQKNNLVRFSIDDDNQQVTVTVSAKELGNGKESISAQITGDSMDIGFNIRYLMEGLKAISTNEIKFNLNQPTQPVIITPLGGLQMTYLIMPVQLKD
jgi:DNA polymerase-3 subunit beta